MIKHCQVNHQPADLQHAHRATRAWAGATIGLAALLAFGFGRTALQAQSPAHDDQRWRGIVSVMPADGFIGEWTIGGRTINADENTEINQEDAPLRVGGCAEVRMGDDDGERGADDDSLAAELKGKADSECNGRETETPASSATPDGATTPEPTGTPTPDDDDDHGHGGDDRYGRVEEMPASGLVGRWVVDSVAYTTTASTEFDPDHGAFAVGVCVEIELVQDDATQVEKLETERDFKCRDGQRQDVVFGEITSFPANLIGDWQIGGLTFVADEQTRFETEHGEFAEGVTVKVKFYEDEAGVNRIIEIETKFAHDDDGRDDDHNGSHDGEDGHTFGVIDSFPAQLIGQWIISGEPYTATENTEFEQEREAFAPGVRVKVEFFLDAAGNKIAQEIKTTHNTGDVDDDRHAKLVGYVEALPASGFVGDWVVGGVALVADEQTKFKEDHGLLVVGAYVTVEYFTVDGAKRIHEIETQVPPGAGDDSAIGQVESMDDSVALAASVAQTWRIGGSVYTVNAATDINDTLSPLTLGGSALVNSYAAADGTQVATRIQGIELDEALYLPVLQR